MHLISFQQQFTFPFSLSQSLSSSVSISFQPPYPVFPRVLTEQLPPFFFRSVIAASQKNSKELNSLDNNDESAGKVKWSRRKTKMMTTATVLMEEKKKNKTKQNETNQ